MLGKAGFIQEEGAGQRGLSRRMRGPDFRVQA